MDDFIKPKQAVEILKVSAETLRTKFAQMKIRRTLEKPYLYSRNDCLTWRYNRTKHAPLPQLDPDLVRRIQRFERTGK
jgi:hypothetical protein